MPFDPRTTASWCLHADRLFDGRRLCEDVAVRVQDGRIVDVGAASSTLSSALPVWHPTGVVVPGFVDLQVNGGAGLMFNNEPTADTLRVIGKALAGAGTTAWLPTFITDSTASMEAATRAVAEAHGRDGVVGVHFEGPHISQEHRGAHAEKHVRRFDDASLNLLSDLRSRQVPVLLTVAPEQMPPGSIATLRELGVTVSLGHTAASARDLLAALAEGASGFTHLFNGMTQMTSRDPGAVGVALDCNAWCGLIADGHHVADSVLRIALGARNGRHRMYLVSDAMATTHGPDSFTLYGETIRDVQGRLINARGSLAGASADLANGVRHLIKVVGIEPAKAIRLATLNPARCMGLDDRCGRIRPGLPLAVALLDSEWRCLGALH